MGTAKVQRKFDFPTNKQEKTLKISFAAEPAGSSAKSPPPFPLFLSRTNPGSLPADKKHHPRRVPLDNNVNKSATLQTSGFPNEPDFYKLRDNAAKVLPFMGVCKCGKVPYKTYVTVDRNDEGVTRFGNVVHCGSVWVCPVCAYKKMKIRQDEIKEIIKLHINSGCSFYFVTLTIRHNLHQPLTVLINGLQAAWKKITKERKLKPLFQAANFIQTLEIRYSDITGWSPHYHMVFMSPDDEKVKPLFDLLIYSWTVKTRSDMAGQKVIKANDAETLSDYIAKISLSLEMTQGQTKTGKKSGSLSYFDMLKSPIENRKKIEEYSAATKGVRSLRKSKGLKITPDDKVKEDTVIDNLVNIHKAVYHATIVKKCDYKLVLENVNSWDWVKEYFKGYEVNEKDKTINPSALIRQLEKHIPKERRRKRGPPGSWGR